MSSITVAAVILLLGQVQPLYWANLGPTNEGKDLEVISAADGKNSPAELGGRPCRALDKGSQYFYVDIVPDFTPVPVVFVTIYYFDQVGTICLEYDADQQGAAYRRSPNVFHQQNAKQWRVATFTLYRPSFQRRENDRTDFRIFVDGGLLALSYVAVSQQPPTGYIPPLDPIDFFTKNPPVKTAPGISVIQQWQFHGPVPPDFLTDAAYEACTRIGITSLQSYVGWAQIEPEQGKVTYQVYDPVVDQIRRHNLKWLPFLIVGPPIATPKWFSAESGVDFVCLEHNQAAPIQSIWNPALRDGVRHFLETFKAHYGPDILEGLELGISGNWGESTMPTHGGFGIGDAHTHVGWWCGDPNARADFKRWLTEKYKDIGSLNAAWHTRHVAFDEIEPFIPPPGPSHRASVDMMDWYMGSMTDFAEFWVKTARELYPSLPIYLCVGGNGDAPHGADMAAQARVCGRYGSGVRITNEGDDAVANFAATRMISSAVRFYGQYYTTEPADDNTPVGIAGRVFDAVSGGARGAYFKGLIEHPGTPTANAVAFAQNAAFLVPNTPHLTAAALMPDSSLAITDETMVTFLKRCVPLRDALDFEYIDENLIHDGMLRRLQAVMLLAGNVLESQTLSELDKWVRDGGVLLIPVELLPLKSVEDKLAEWVGQALSGADGQAAKSSLSSGRVADALALTATPRGRGFVVIWPGDWGTYAQLLNAALHAAATVTPWKSQIAEPIDAVFDKVLTTRVGNALYYYDGLDVPVKKNLPGRGNVDLPPRTIVKAP